MTNHPTARTREEWIEARTRLLAMEKELTRLRDRLSAQRRALPWLEVQKPYVFDGRHGRQRLRDVFAGRQQLIIYHFMFGPDWEAGCKSCSFWADNFNGIIPHLEHRDVAFAVVSRAPLAKLTAFARRLGWSFAWLSSEHSDFNRDFGVSFTPAEVAQGEIPYNYGRHPAHSTEMPGISVFYRDGEKVFHTYSTYARGLDMLNTAYHYLDLVPKGRDEADGIMAWLRLRDEYGD